MMRFHWPISVNDSGIPLSCKFSCHQKLYTTIKSSHCLDLLCLDDRALFQQWVRLDGLGVGMLTGVEITKQRLELHFTPHFKTPMRWQRVLLVAQVVVPILDGFPFDEPKIRRTIQQQLIRPLCKTRAMSLLTVNQSSSYAVPIANDRP
jgi:hypothetical protein